jgi:hypothetical protein
MTGMGIDGAMGGVVFGSGNRMSIKGPPTVATKARAEAARKAARTADRLIRTYVYRENLFIDDSEMSIDDVDLILITRIIRKLPEEAQKAYGLEELTEKIKHQMIEYRRATLDMVCSDREIRALYFSLLRRDPPTHGEIQMCTDGDISKLVYALSGGETTPLYQEEMQGVQDGKVSHFMQDIATLSQKASTLPKSEFERCFEVLPFGFVETFREFLAALNRNAQTI